MENEPYFVTIKELQAALDAHFHRYGSCCTAVDALEQLHTQGHYYLTQENYKLLPSLSHMEFDEFLIELGNIRTGSRSIRNESLNNDASYFFDDHTAVFLRPSFHHDLHTMHKHGNFQIGYIYRGSYAFCFMDEEEILTEGDLVIISPNALHNFKEQSEDAFMVTFYLNLQTLNTTFLSILSAGDFLSNFFKEVLTNLDNPNYLLLSCGTKNHLKYQIQDMIIEQYKYDRFAPECSLCRLKVFLSDVMRCYTAFRQYNDCGSRIDFGPVLEYISRNYKSATLGEISKHFNYSASYLSTTIHNITGKTYSTLIREARLREAEYYLRHTDHTIVEVARLCGYNNADHFTRTFRAQYGYTPKQFRQDIRNCS